MSSMFCIKCGKKADVGNFCDSCFLEKNELFAARDIKIVACKECSRYFDIEWKKYSDERELVRNVAEKNIRTENKITEKTISIRLAGGGYIAEIKCSGFIPPCRKQKTEIKKIIVIVKKRKCDDCVKVSGNYYEAVVQLRGHGRDKILKKIEKIISPRIVISRVEENPHGYDLYFISKKDSASLVKKLSDLKNLNVSVKKTYKLAGEKKGTKLYRDYYAIR